jgi:protein-tyrosine phosphatase
MVSRRGFNTEIDEMSRIPYKDSFPSEEYHELFVSGIRPARDQDMVEQNSIWAVLSLGTENTIEQFAGFADPERYMVIDIADNEKCDLG